MLLQIFHIIGWMHFLRLFVNYKWNQRLSQTALSVLSLSVVGEALMDCGWSFCRLLWVRSNSLTFPLAAHTAARLREPPNKSQRHQTAQGLSERHVWTCAYTPSERTSVFEEYSCEGWTHSFTGPALSNSPLL